MVVLVGINLMAGTTTSTYLNQNYDLYRELVYWGSSLGLICLTALWSFGQRRIPRSGCQLGAAVLVASGMVGWFYNSSLFSAGMATLASLSCLATLALALRALRRRGYRVSRWQNIGTSRTPVFQFSLRSLILLMLVASLLSTFRIWVGWVRYPMSHELIEPLMYGLFLGLMPAMISITAIFACLSLARWYWRFGGLLAATAGSAAIVVFVVTADSGWDSEFMIDVFVLYAAQATFMAAVLLVVRRVYGLRVVRVPRRVARSLE